MKGVVIRVLPVRRDALRLEESMILAGFVIPSGVVRPDLKAAPLGVVSRILRLAQHFRIQDKRVLHVVGVEPWAFEVLAALRRQGPPFTLSPTGLRRAALLTSGAMTNRLDRLEDLGWVQRRPDPDDRRGIAVRLTALGRRVVDRALDERIANAERLLAPLSGSERKTLAALLKKVLVPLTRVPPGAP